MSIFMNFRPSKKFVDNDAKNRLSLSAVVFAGKLHNRSSVKMKATLVIWCKLRKILSYRSLGPLLFKNTIIVRSNTKKVRSNTCDYFDPKDFEIWISDILFQNDRSYYQEKPCKQQKPRHSVLGINFATDFFLPGNEAIQGASSNFKFQFSQSRSPEGKAFSIWNSFEWLEVKKLTVKCETWLSTNS